MVKFNNDGMWILIEDSNIDEIDFSHTFNSTWATFTEEQKALIYILIGQALLSKEDRHI